jgi:hypothetical protein
LELAKKIAGQKCFTRDDDSWPPEGSTMKLVVLFVNPAVVRWDECRGCASGSVDGRNRCVAGLSAAKGWDR